MQKLQPAYGILNAKAKYTFPGENFAISLFGTNLTNEWYEIGGFKATLGGVDHGLVARPREVGLGLSIDY